MRFIIPRFPTEGNLHLFSPLSSRKGSQFSSTYREMARTTFTERAGPLLNENHDRDVSSVERKRPKRVYIARDVLCPGSPQDTHVPS